MVELVECSVSPMPVPGGFVGPALGGFERYPVPWVLWTGIWVAIGGDDGDLWQPFTQLVTVIVDVVKTVSMDPPPRVSVTGQVVTVVYVVRVSVPFGGADGAPVEDGDDRELKDEEGSEVVEGLPVPVNEMDDLEVIGIVDVPTTPVERDVVLEPHESFWLAAAEPARTAAKNINEACILEVLSGKDSANVE